MKSANCEGCLGSLLRAYRDGLENDSEDTENSGKFGNWFILLRELGKARKMIKRIETTREKYENDSHDWHELGKVRKMIQRIEITRKIQNNDT